MKLQEYGSKLPLSDIKWRRVFSFTLRLFHLHEQSHSSHWMKTVLGSRLVLMCWWRENPLNLLVLRIEPGSDDKFIICTFSMWNSASTAWLWRLAQKLILLTQTVSVRWPSELNGFERKWSHRCNVLSNTVNVSLWKYEDFTAIGDLHLRGVVPYIGVVGHVTSWHAHVTHNAAQTQGDITALDAVKQLIRQGDRMKSRHDAGVQWIYWMRCCGQPTRDGPLNW
jgi:hypothetical protein